MLTILLDDSGQVAIIPENEFSNNQWGPVVAFWAPNTFRSTSNRLILIPIEVFVEKMNWLREVWIAQGGKLNLSANLIQAAKAVQEGARDFKRLKTLEPERHHGGLIEVPGLVESRILTAEQMENVLCLLDMNNGSNFSVPGAGKTLTALAVWKVLRARGNIKKVLVISPRPAFESWRSELQESFGETTNFEVYSNQIINDKTELCVVNYEQLENPQKLSYLASWLRAQEGLLIVDEAHRIKGGAQSVRWNAVKALSASALRTDVLTGTPMPQGPKDLISIYSVTWPRLTRTDLDGESLVYLRRKTAFVRTTKSELKLPPVTPKLISECAGPLHSQILSALQDRYIGDFGFSIADQRNMARRGKAVMTMLAAATNPGLLVSRQFQDIEMGFSWPPIAVSEDKGLSDLIQEYLKHEIPWKFRYAALRAQEIANRGEKVLIWSSFVGNLAGLKKVLTKFEPAVVYGGTPGDLRVGELKRFREDPNCSVLLSNPQTLGEGISLHQECHSEIFIDRTFNAGLYLQAVDRIHRLGLDPTQDTTIEILETAGSIDERVTSRLAVKIEALARFLDDEKLTQTALPQDDALNPIDVLGLTDDDFSDIAKHWNIPIDS